jgi:hypothetical protein
MDEWVVKRGTDLKLKYLELKSILELETYEIKGLLRAVWDLAAENATRGDIGRMSNQQIAIGIGWKGDADRLIQSLVNTRWLDVHPLHRLVIHDWKEHCEDWVKKRVERGGQGWAVDDTMDQPSESVRQRPTTSDNGGSRPRKPEPVTSNQIDIPKKRPNPQVAKADVSPLWLAWLREYPKRSGDRKCASGEAKFKALLKSGTAYEDLLAGVKRYRSWCDFEQVTGTSRVQQITTWLNGKAWLEPFEIPASAPSAPAKVIDPTKVEIPEFRVGA